MGRARRVETPIPQDWVGFATQVLHQRSGGSSYLLGERRMTGWWYYYFVALAVKVPLTFWVLVLGRAVLGMPAVGGDGPGCCRSAIAAFLAITALGSIAQLRPPLPLAAGAAGDRLGLGPGRGGPVGASGRPWVGLAGQAVAVASIHPHELTYFNALAGGPLGGPAHPGRLEPRLGPGVESAGAAPAGGPEFRDLTLYYFGETDPAHYGVAGTCHVIDAPGIRPGPPPALTAETAYVAVSASLQWGPWGPAGYFRCLDASAPSR